jgi:hypothetical protein
MLQSSNKVASGPLILFLLHAGDHIEDVTVYPAWLGLSTSCSRLVTSIATLAREHASWLVREQYDIPNPYHVIELIRAFVHAKPLES